MPADSIAFLIGNVSRQLRQLFDVRSRTLGVSRAQWQVLYALSRNEGINQTDLSAYLEAETITLSRVINRLAEAGLVERRANPADGRERRLHLTTAAHPLLEQLGAIGDEVVATAVAGLDPTQINAVIAVLAAIRTNLSRRSPLDTV